MILTQEYKKIYARWYVAPTPYWEVRRVLILSGIILVLVIVIFAIRHYLSLKRMNRDLKYSLEEQKKAEETRQVSVQRDITEHKRTEQKLRESEERFRKIFDKAPLGIVIVSPSFGFEKANPAFCHMMGYSENELRSMTFADITYPDYLKQDMENVTKVGRSEMPFYQTEKRYINKSGKILWGNLIVSSIRDEHGALRCYLSMVIDITKRKEAQEALRRSEENFRRSFDDSPMGVRIVTEEGETIYINRAILDIYGYDSIEDLRTTPLKKRYTPESYAEFQIRREKRKRGDYNPSKYEISIVRKNGEVRHLQVIRKAILWNGEKQFQIIYQDITKRKRAEEALRASREQLRALAGRLQAVREEERTQIAREIHDELGGALTGLKIDFSLLTRAALKIENETVRTSLLADMGSMIKSIDTTIHTVRRIAMELRPGVLDDLGLVAALEWQLKDFEKRTGIRCKFFPPVENISLDADLSTALFRIFQEALTNVVRHSGATEVRVLLRVDADSSTLEVEDNGKGIEKEKTVSKESLGILGMRERSQIFGGRFTVTGTPGRGTKVTVEISPVEKGRMDQDQEGAAE